MKSENIFCAMNDLDPRLIEKSAPSDQKRITGRVRVQCIQWASAAACLCLCIIACLGIWQGAELAPAEIYVYTVNEGPFSAYVGGKVISEDKIGSKVADVTLTAGWQNAAGSQWLSQEALRGEIYAIEGIAGEVAVALRFIDQGEAVTTTHYYVFMNPHADLSAVADYRIHPDSSGTAGELAAE